MRRRRERDHKAADLADQDADPNRATEPQPAFDASRGRGRDEESNVPEHEDQSDKPSAVVQAAHEIDDQHRVEHGGEIVRRRRAARDRAKGSVPEHVPEPFADVSSHGGPLGPRHCLDGWFGTADEQDCDRRKNEAHGIDDHRDGCTNELHQRSRQPRSRDLRATSAHLEFRVAVAELIAIDERRQVRLVRDVEEHREHTRDEHHDEQLAKREPSEPPREGDRCQRDRAPDVAGHEDRPAADAVDNDAGREAEEQERGELDGAERADREGARVERLDREQRQRQQADLAPQLADRLGGPQPDEVRVAEERSLAGTEPAGH